MAAECNMHPNASTDAPVVALFRAGQHCEHISLKTLVESRSEHTAMSKLQGQSTKIQYAHLLLLVVEHTSSLQAVADAGAKSQCTTE